MAVEISILIRVSTLRECFRQNLTLIIDVQCERQLKARTGWYKRVQVQDGPAVFPQKGVEKVSAIGGAADDLATCIQTEGLTTRVVFHGAEIVNFSRLPDHGVVRLAAWKIGIASDLACFIEPKGRRVVATECSKIGQSPRLAKGKHG